MVEHAFNVTGSTQFLRGLDFLGMRRFLSYSECLLGLILDCVFGGCGGFGISR